MTQDFDLTRLSFSHSTRMLTEVTGLNEATQGSQSSHAQHLPMLTPLRCPEKKFTT